MRLWRGTLAAIAALFLTGGTAVAADANGSGRAGNPPGYAADGGALAKYNGRTINLSEGWQGARICVEQTDASFRCYDDEAAYRAAEQPGGSAAGIGARALSDCPYGYFCLWDDRLYSAQSRRVQYRSLGSHDLASVDFENRANSVYNRRSGWTIAYDDTCSSEYLWVETMIPELSLRNRQHCSGSWNNKIDRVSLRA
ncbi:hypothetical protein SUDANB6_00752 [Streptomyces sp. enrichment culture]|uniref:peptidase inhibitor family I36 protein n=1 Tax=Streptomyces sp. enrichment culture TaxID=1795815 RepID=UPI003F57AEB6